MGAQAHAAQRDPLGALPSGGGKIDVPRDTSIFLDRDPIGQWLNW